MRMAEAIDAGISRKTLYAMLDEGVVERLSRGVYRLASLPSLEAPDLVTVSTRVPDGVICLIYALAFHELTTQIPRAVDIAIARGAEPPRIDYPPIQRNSRTTGVPGLDRMKQRSTSPLSSSSQSAS